MLVLGVLRSVESAWLLVLDCGGDCSLGGDSSQLSQPSGSAGVVWTVSCRWCLELVASGVLAASKTVPVSAMGESLLEVFVIIDVPRAGNLVGAVLSCRWGVSASSASAF